MFIKKISFLLFLILAVPGSAREMSAIGKINNEILAEFSKEMKSEGLYAVGQGGGEKDGKFNLIEIGFKVNKILDVDSGRRLIVDSVDRLSKIINSNEKYREYFDPFPIDTKILRIDFFGEEPRTKNPCEIWIASLYGGIIHYEGRNDNPRPPFLMKLHEETLEEAREIVSRESTNS